MYCYITFICIADNDYIHVYLDFECFSKFSHKRSCMYWFLHLTFTFCSITFPRLQSWSSFVFILAECPFHNFLQNSTTMTFVQFTKARQYFLFCLFFLKTCICSPFPNVIILSTSCFDKTTFGKKWKINLGTNSYRHYEALFVVLENPAKATWHFSCDIGHNHLRSSYLIYLFCFFLSIRYGKH